MDYQFKDIEKKWQAFWAERQMFKAENQSSKPKYYVLDMFPYPSGAGLHVGHPLGYIASDIFSRYKRLKGFNVLHPMGYDSFGLPAEQYAIQTGQHPAITTEENIATYRRQLDQIGFSFDWSREVRTSEPGYYKWTQWIFMQLFNSWYNKDVEKAESIDNLDIYFAQNGSAGINAVCDDDTARFTAEEWNGLSFEAQQTELLKYRLTYLRESTVNWCPALGTVLANDEVKDGFSERGGYPVEQKKMMQWSMRITAYAERLLQGLDHIDWPEPLKEMQRNWIGKSVGAMVSFKLEAGRGKQEATFDFEPQASKLEAGSWKQEATFDFEPQASKLEAGNRKPEATFDFEPQASKLEAGNRKPEAENEMEHEASSFKPQASSFIEVFTTRVDTIFGVTSLVIAPEHELVAALTTPEQKADIEACIAQAKKKSELDRMADTKTITGAFTGSYVINPVNGDRVPVWIADYVLAGYGTGAVMGVPSGDQRDYLFAKHFNLPIVPIIDIQNIETEADPTKEGKYINSGFINGMGYKEATQTVIAELERMGAGYAKINYRMRDAIFGRQRYWGEPVPVYFKDGLPYLIDESELPLVLPEVDKFLPTESGEPPLGRATNWSYKPAPSKSPPGGETLTALAVSGYRDTADPVYYEQLKEYSRANRNMPTEAENLLWQLLRKEQTGYKFRRQHAIGQFIADFASLQKGIIIEVDGGYHDETKEADAARTEILGHLGFSVLRFTNNEILSSPQTVANKIKQHLNLLPDKVSPTGGDLEGAGAFPYELSTMPGWAGSSWYWYRYMDAQNTNEFASAEAIKYWRDVDLYIGGSEHATGHLLYSRFWNKFLKDIGKVNEEEPFKKLINQGMIQGRSNFVYRLNYKLIPTFNFIREEGEDEEVLLNKEAGWFNDVIVKLPLIFISHGLVDKIKFDADFKKNIEKQINDTLLSETLIIHKGKVILNLSSENLISKIHVDVNIVQNDTLDTNRFKKWRPELKNAEFVFEDGSISSPSGGGREGAYNCGVEIEKMSKSKFNVVNPDDIIERYGADTLRMYEMFLGPLEQSKPWNTNGIEGVFKFLRKFWRLFHNEQWEVKISEAEPSKAELKSLHKIIRKVEEDIDRFSFNTSVSSFMIAVNELTDLKCNKRAILQDMVVILSPYAPHICEELWVMLGNEAGTISYAPYPEFKPEYLVENEFAYPVSVNGKARMNINLPLSLDNSEVEQMVLANADLLKYLDGKTPKKVIVVKGRIINLVV